MKYKITNFYDKLIKIDKLLLIAVYFLTFISCVFVYSATRSLRYLQMNILWILVGSVFMLFFTFVNYKIFKNYILHIYILSILMLLYVRFFGRTILGAKRWVSIFGFSFRPSEIVKILIVIILSYIIITKYRRGIRNIVDIFTCFLHIVPILALIFLQPDLGTTMIIVFSYLCILFLCEANIKPLVYIGIFAIISAYPVYRFVLTDYQRTRIDVFVNPEKDIKNKGWHVTQSKISIGSGGLTGAGIFNGSQSRLKFLPEPQTDFIFSVIAEETGFIGAFIVLSLYFIILYRMLAITRIIDDEFGKNIIFGIVGIFLAHIIINIGMTIGLVPVTGKTLLFLSYGGSSFLSSFIMIGLVQSIKVHAD